MGTFGVWGLGFRVWGLGFRAEGFGAASAACEVLGFGGINLRARPSGVRLRFATARWGKAILPGSYTAGTRPCGFAC